MSPSDDFDEYRLMLLDRLDKLESAQIHMAEEMREGSLKIVAEVSALKVKSGLWGAIAGAIPAAIAIVYSFLKGGL